MNFILTNYYQIFFFCYFLLNIFFLEANEVNKKKWLNIRNKLWENYKKEYKKNSTKYENSDIVMEEKFVKNKDKKMPYVIMKRGTKPKEGWSLFISMHGGGGNSRVSGPHSWSVNTREWETQKIFVNRGVFSSDGLYFIPRMTDDRKGRWKSLYNIEIFRKVISEMILRLDVDSNRIYIMGISQGGYGTGHIAPLLADYFAAANGMAGGMNIDADNLLNLPFRSDIGEFDKAFKRIELARKSHKRLGELSTKYKGYYINKLSVQRGRGHGINYSAGTKWMVKYKRNPYPKKIIWKINKNGLFKTNFYWIGIKKKEKYNVKVDTKIEVDVSNNVVDIRALQNCPGSRRRWTELEIYDVVVNLSDDIVDLDKKVIINLNGVEKLNKKFDRSEKTLLKTMKNRNDKYYSFPVQITLQ